jgi:two-component system response regulator DevR
MNLFIVEDAPRTRKELANLLADEKGFAVVGEAGSVREALVGIKATLPEAVVLDISLPCDERCWLCRPRLKVN